MELIKPNFEIWEQGNTLADIWKHIAKCTRVCYQSTPKNDGETEEEFVKRVILRNEPWNSDANHLAMLEHGTVYLNIFPNDDFGQDFITMFMYNKYSKCTRIMINNVGYAITTNLRVIIENNLYPAFKYVCEPTEYHNKRVTVSFTTNIGVTREFNRHRVDSPSEESTRFCNYNKRNDGQIKIGLPAWLLDDENMGYIEHHADDELHSYCTDIADGDDTNWCDIDYYLFALSCAEYCYNNLIAKGWKPQQAREVLPLATKSQLIHTAFISDWKHFFKLRADGVSGPPHPNAELLAKPLKEEFIKHGYI